MITRHKLSIALGDFWGGLAAMLACDVPIVAAIAGNCMGAGMEIASCCDIRIAATNAVFAMPEVEIGIPSIIQAALVLTRAPGQFGLSQVQALRDAGLTDQEILDMLHSAPLFGWANRLMLNLGVEIYLNQA